MEHCLIFDTISITWEHNGVHHIGWVCMPACVYLCTCVSVYICNDACREDKCVFVFQ